VLEKDRTQPSAVGTPRSALIGGCRARSVPHHCQVHFSGPRADLLRPSHFDPGRVKTLDQEIWWEKTPTDYRSMHAAWGEIGSQRPWANPCGEVVYQISRNSAFSHSLDPFETFRRCR
jgi:hypothetical protein